MKTCARCEKTFDIEYVANHVHGIEGLEPGTKVFLTTAIVVVKPGAGAAGQAYLHLCGDCLRVELMALADRIEREVKPGGGV